MQLYLLPGATGNFIIGIDDRFLNHENISPNFYAAHVLGDISPYAYCENNPRYGVWMESHHHLSKALEYNEKWRVFFRSTPTPTVMEIEKEAKKIMKTVYNYEY